MAGNFFTKAIGLAALGIAAHDTISTTGSLAPKYERKLRLEQLNDVYMKTCAMDSPSVIGSKMQNWSRKWALDNNLFSTRQKIVSNVVCFSKKFADNIVLFGLGAAALLTGKGKFSLLKIPCLNKIAAAILLLKGAGFVLHSALGIGGKDYRNNSMDY